MVAGKVRERIVASCERSVGQCDRGFGSRNGGDGCCDHGGRSRGRRGQVDNRPPASLEGGHACREQGSLPCKFGSLSIIGSDASCEARVERDNELVIPCHGITVSCNPLVTRCEPASGPRNPADASLDAALLPFISRFSSIT